MKEKENKRISDDEIDFLDDLDLDLDDLDLDDIDDIDSSDVIESGVKEPEFDNIDEDIDNSNIKDLDDLDDLDFDFDDEEEKEDKKDSKKSKDDEDDLFSDEDEEEDKPAKSNKKDSDKASKKTSTTKSASKKITEIDDEEEEKDSEESTGVSGWAKIAGVLVILAVIVFLLLKGCSKEEYTIKFDTNGGNTISEQKVAKDGTVSRPVDPTREGYEFLGWYVGDDMYDFDTKVTEGFTIEARWQEVAKAAVTGVRLDQTSVAVKPGGAITLVATVEPSNAGNKGVTWESTNPTVATVDENGNVTALKAGTAYIKVTTKEGGYTAQATVTVTQDVVSVTGVTITRADPTVGVNNNTTLTAKVTPNNASNKGITWSSSDTSIATVNQNGVVTGKKDGTVTITATSKDGGYKASATVVVKTINVTRLTVNPTTMTLIKGKTAKITATVAPANASDKTVTWTSDNTNVATVVNGTVTAKAVGTTTITAKTKDGNITKTVSVTVRNPILVEAITVSGTNEVEVGKTVQLTATVNPTNADNKNVTWTSSNNSIAKVDSKGKVTGVSAGTVTITAKAADGSNISSTPYSITVKEKPASYKVILKATRDDVTHTLFGYSATVLKNGSNFSNWKTVNCGGGAISNGGNGQQAKSTPTTGATCIIYDATGKIAETTTVEYK